MSDRQKVAYFAAENQKLRSALEQILVETGSIDSDYFRPEIAAIARSALKE